MMQPPVERGRTYKALRAAAALARTPRRAPGYVRDLVTPRSPLVMGLPWFAHGAVDFLDRFVTEDMTVFEYGAGGSTVFFGQRAGRVISVESDPAWATAVEERLRSLNLSNVELMLAPAEFSDVAAFATSAFAQAFRTEGLADVVVVDSFDYFAGHPLRPILFREALSLMTPRGVLVLDDAHRYVHLRSAAPGRKALTFAGLGPGRRSVTSTDVYVPERDAELG